MDKVDVLTLLEFLVTGVCLNSGLSSWEEVRRRLASDRGCVGSTRLRRLVLAAASTLLAGSAIDEAY